MPPVNVTRTYLRMRDRASLRPGRPLPANARVDLISPCPASRYRQLYRAVGDQWHWHDRNAWSDERLGEQLSLPGVTVHALSVDGADAGYFELQQHDDADVEIVYFGLVPSFIGRGLGGALLTRAIEEAWSRGATEVWLHTCTLDHPSALRNYQARGFTIDRTEQYTANID